MDTSCHRVGVSTMLGSIPNTFRNLIRDIYQVIGNRLRHNITFHPGYTTQVYRIPQVRLTRYQLCIQLPSPPGNRYPEVFYRIIEEVEREISDRLREWNLIQLACAKPA